MNNLPITVGARASREWLSARGLASDRSWFVEIALDIADRPASSTYSGDTDTRFHLNLYPLEWSLYFCHGSRASWIRVTDQPFVHGRDDYRFLEIVPRLDDVATFLATLEAVHRLRFRREHALIYTNVTGARGAVRSWLTRI